METLVTKSRLNLPKHRRRLAYVHGARSAFDMSGLGTFNDTAFRPRSLGRTDPTAMVARDMATVMDGFRRSSLCALRALRAGTRVEDLEPGCTRSGAYHESRGVPPDTAGVPAAR